MVWSLGIRLPCVSTFLGKRVCVTAYPHCYYHEQRQSTQGKRNTTEKEPGTLQSDERTMRHMPWTVRRNTLRRTIRRPAPIVIRYRRNKAGIPVERVWLSVSTRRRRRLEQPSSGALHLQFKEGGAGGRNACGKGKQAH